MTRLAREATSETRAVMSGYRAYVAGTDLATVIVAALAAIASWRGASAASRAARRSDETSRRANEALGRATQPELVVDLRADDELCREPQPMTLYVRNVSANIARRVTVGLTRVDGHPSPRIDESPAMIGPVSDLSFSLGLVPRLTLDPSPVISIIPRPLEAPIFRYVLRFSDNNGFLTWEQRGTIHEAASASTSRENTLGGYTGCYLSRPGATSSAMMGRRALSRD